MRVMCWLSLRVIVYKAYFEATAGAQALGAVVLDHMVGGR